MKQGDLLTFPLGTPLMELRSNQHDHELDHPIIPTVDIDVVAVIGNEDSVSIYIGSNPLLRNYHDVMLDNRVYSINDIHMKTARVIQAVDETLT